ncbi:potassium/proton antiporter, partial [Rhizobium ruizarguesonis]
FGAFALSPARPAADLDAAYGPGLLNESEKGLTIAELMRQRLGGKADYADRVRLGSIILIVRDLDEHDHVTSVGMSLEAVEPAITLPIFINLKDIIQRVRDRLNGRRNRENAVSETPPKAPAGRDEGTRENGR